MAEDHDWKREARNAEGQRGADAAGGEEAEDPEFPNIRAMREFDREAHIRRSMAAGATREEAEAHADAELAERDDSHE